jgi:hypothetical protein
LVAERTGNAKQNGGDLAQRNRTRRRRKSPAGPGLGSRRRRRWHRPFAAATAADPIRLPWQRIAAE